MIVFISIVLFFRSSIRFLWLHLRFRLVHLCSFSLFISVLNRSSWFIFFISVLCPRSSPFSNGCIYKPPFSLMVHFMFCFWWNLFHLFHLYSYVSFIYFSWFYFVEWNICFWWNLFHYFIWKILMKHEIMNNEILNF